MQGQGHEDASYEERNCRCKGMGVIIQREKLRMQGQGNEDASYEERNCRCKGMGVRMHHTKREIAYARARRRGCILYEERKCRFKGMGVILLREKLRMQGQGDDDASY